ncbi:protein phosphatase [Coprinopsis cinerea okayama7|uniref:Protein phosphatase n=1 Tax=Coprinopsis cinerea (strain Okayama-7 / 130 / ATCC MYA-4618 / FGSC 9003) TaxID=240176 RepID=A8NEX8_COPC7|nr:protein phosphatase [Coprinopsis cinerea okayama7\|eukprot:XP_001833158.2 protein phosphatase [Coprinopsis cinerea okayama7\
MDAIRVSKVEGVSFTKAGKTNIGTIHLTAHHIIFRYRENEEDQELWTLNGRSPLDLHTRTFESFTFSFEKDPDALNVFESVKELTVATSVTQLYAFFYTPNPPLPTNNGWSIYSPREEYGRMGVGTRTKAWRFTDINRDYSFAPTYPSRLVVPTKISDTTLQYASKYRSKCRLPVLTYLHWANYGTLTRSSQPMVGITQNRSVQDEKLIEAIFQSHWSPESRTSSSPVYGATSTNLIIDARPTVNAVANSAKGAGTENMDNYKEGKKVYLGIDHIHTMRESLAKVVEALREADTLLASFRNDIPDTVSTLDRQALRRSGWLRHIAAILEGTVLIVRNVHVNSSHVLIHCSDGWDRTSQLSAMSQICLDPFYRTIRGFEILVEKDWLSFGHKFLDRCGHLSSEKFFLSPSSSAEPGSGAEAAQAFFTSVQNRFTSQNHIRETSPIFHQFLESVRQLQRQFPERFEYNERFLRQLYYHLYSCQFGTFLFNTERERKVGDGIDPPATERTVSIWDFFNSPAEMALNTNPLYDPSLDDPKGRDMGVLIPNSKDIRFWHELYGRTDEEMNGRLAQPPAPEVVGPVASGDEDAGTDRPITPSNALSDSPSASAALPLASSQVLSLPAGSRSASPSVDAGLKNLSLSAPSLSAPNPARRSSVNSGSPGSSTSALRAHTSSSSPPPSSSPLWGRAKPPDFLSSTGVKSVWGRLSSNATAAFSVVQDAYAGMAKDLNNNFASGSEDGTQKTSELRSREALRTWGEGSESSPPSTQPSSISPGPTSLPSLTLTNPWATAAPRSSRAAGLSIVENNPWGSNFNSDSEPISSQSQTGPDPLSALPADPTVEVPSASRQNPATVKRVPQREVSPPPRETASVNIDPLGVGLR